MVLRRSNSMSSTLSTIQRRTTRYERYLNMGNVFLEIVSIVLIFYAVILLRYYHIQALAFWTVYFIVVPATMICLGIYTFGACLFGFYATSNVHRCSLVVYAFLMSFAFLVQITSIFFGLELRTIVTQANIGAIAVNDVLKRYGTDSWVTYTWDEMQRRLHCCGGNNFQTGYNDWRNTPIGIRDSVPDSCCHNEAPGCGRNILSKQLNMDVVPMVVIYASLGTVLAIVELIMIVLASAYVAQITRRKMREDMLWQANNAHLMPAGGNGGGLGMGTMVGGGHHMDQHQMAPSIHGETDII